MTKCPCDEMSGDEMSVRRNVHVTKYPCDEMSMCPNGCDEMSGDEMSSDEMSASASMKHN